MGCWAVIIIMIIIVKVGVVDIVGMVRVGI